MFAYCLNNPTNSSDPCGTCRHRIDFWNDCDECGGKTLGDKLVDFATVVADYQAMVREDQRKQTELQLQLVNSMIQAQVRAEQEMAEQQRMQDYLVGKFVAGRFATLEKAANTLTGVGLILDAGAAYLGAIAAKLSVPTLGLSVATAGKAAAVLGLASIPFHAAAWVLNILDEE